MNPVNRYLFYATVELDEGLEPSSAIYETAASPSTLIQQMEPTS